MIPFLAQLLALGGCLYCPECRTIASWSHVYRAATPDAVYVAVRRPAKVA